MGKVRRAERKEALSREREQQILQAAAAVFAEKGFQKATTREIAAAAGVAEGTIYNYFASKRDLIVAMVVHIAADSLGDLVAQRDTLDDRSFLRSVLSDRLALVERHRQALPAVFYELLTDPDLRQRYFYQAVLPAVSLMHTYVAERIKAGTFRGFNPRVVMPAMIGGLLGTAIANTLAPEDFGAFAGPRPTREELIDNLADFFLHGLLNPSRCGASPEQAAAAIASREEPADERS